MTYMSRPRFDMGGRVVVRRGELALGGGTYVAGVEVPWRDEGVTEQRLTQLWEQGYVDTLPPAPTPAPPVPAGKPQIAPQQHGNHNHRR